MLVVRMWGFPWLTYLALAVMALNLVAMAFIPSQRVPLMVGVVSGLFILGASGLRSALKRERQPSSARQSLFPRRRES